MISMDSMISRVTSSVRYVAFWQSLAIHLIAVAAASSPAAETISVNVHKTLTDVSEQPVGLCASFINDSDIHHHRDRTMTAVLRQTRVGNYRYPMGALAENYVWHPHGEYDAVAGGLRPRAISAQAFPLKGALDEEGYFRREMDYDEFIHCCRQADVDPIICVSSYGWKLPGARLDRRQLIESASEWVRYANVIHDHGVRYWEIGNEVELHKKQISADEYFAFFRDARRAMKSIDPTIRVGLGLMGNRDYIQQALRQFPNEIDFVVCHQYSNAIKNYAQYKNNAWRYISGIENTIKTIDEFAPPEVAERLEVLVTEYSAFSPGRAWGNRDNNIVKALLTFEQTGNALCCDDRIRTLNFWVTHSPWGGRGVTAADALDSQNRLTAMGKTLEVMARFLKTKMVEAPRVVGRLRSYASYAPKTKELSVYVLNKNDRSEKITVALPGYEGPSTADVYQFAGAAPAATEYTWTKRDGITHVDEQLQSELAPLSITVFHFVSKRNEPAVLTDPAKPPIQAKGEAFDIRRFGAVGDGKTLNTEAFRKAIAAATARPGHDTVLVPAGTFHTGLIELQSDLTLHLAEGAVILGSKTLADYDSPEPRDEDVSNWLRGLLVGKDVSRVFLEGSGTIDGNKVRDPRGEEGQRGPHTVRFADAEHITVRDIRIIDSGNYAILLHRSKHGLFENLRIEGGWDAIHWRWGEDFTVRKCRMFTGDDCLAGRSWKNTLIEDCYINTSCNGIRVFADIHNLRVRKCVFEGPGKHPHITQNRHNMLAAIIFQPGAWRQPPSHSSNILFEDLTIRKVKTAIHCSLREGNSLEKLTIRNVNATGIYGPACSVESWGKPIKNVRLQHYSVHFTPDGATRQVAGKWRPAGLGVRPLPAWAFYARNVKGLLVDKASWSSAKPVEGPPLIFENVSEADTSNVIVNGESYAP